MPERDDYSATFKESEKVGRAAAHELIVQFTKEFPTKKDVSDRLYFFSAASAGYLSSFLYYAYHEMLRLEKECGAEKGTAELWLQKTVSVFIQAIAKDNVPVDIKFMAVREKGGSH